MSQPDNSSWLGWVVPAVIAVCAGLWAFLKRFFSFVTRSDVLKMHAQNQAILAALERRVNKIAEDVAYLRGRDR